MSTIPLISVVVPVFNAERYLAIAIDSILAQTYSNIELILVNDGSTDNSGSIISSYSDTRIRSVTFEQNRGLVAALNKGVELAHGDYIARMDADDIAFPNRLATQLQYLQQNRREICGSWLSVIGSGNRLIRYPESNGDIKFSMLIMCPMAHPAVLGEARLFKENPYTSVAKAAEDYELWVRLAEQGTRFGNVQEPLLHYRMHSLQVSVIQSSKTNLDSEFIAKRFASTYLHNDQLVRVESLGFGWRPHYSRSEVVQLVELLFELSRERKVGKAVMEEFVPAIFRKIQPMEAAVFLDYIALLRKLGVPISSWKSFNVAIQSFLRVKRTSWLFNFLKRFARS